MRFRNSTGLDSARLEALFLSHVRGWPHDDLAVYVRPGRGAPFSGVCDYRSRTIRVNVGGAVRYPYWLATGVGRACTVGDLWWRPVYKLEIADGYRLALFVFLHEFYHWLVRLARRNTRQKEARCDRFAVRALVDQHGARLVDSRGRVPLREDWDFQDLDGFVAAARSRGRRGVRNLRANAACGTGISPAVRPLEGARPSAATGAGSARQLEFGFCPATGTEGFSERPTVPAASIRRPARTGARGQHRA